MKTRRMLSALLAATTFVSLMVAIQPHAFAMVINKVVNVDTSVEYATLQAAWEDVSSGQTLKLLDDIDETYSLIFTTGDVTIDMDGHDIDLNTGVLAGGGGNLDIIGGGTIYAELIQSSVGALTVNADIVANEEVGALVGGSVTVVGQIHAGGIGIYANSASTIDVTGDVFAAEDGVEARGGSTVTINGDVFAVLDGVHANGDSTTVTVNGTITTDLDHQSATITDYELKYGGVYVTGSAVVTVNGDILVSGDGGVGVNAYWQGKANVNGDILVYGTSAVGVYTGIDAVDDRDTDLNEDPDGIIISFEDDEIMPLDDEEGSGSGVIVNVNGDIMASGDRSLGVFAAMGAKVVVEGTITASLYVALLDDSGDTPQVLFRTISQNNATSARAGYRQYSGGDPVSWVWVKAGAVVPVDEPDPTTPTNPTTPRAPGTPRTGDALGWAASALALALAAGGVLALKRRSSAKA